MRTIARYELKEGENRVTVPDLSVIVCATDLGEKVCVWMEIDAEAKEFVDMAFLVIREGAEIEEEMVLNYVGYARLISGEVVIVFEIL